MPLTSRLYSDTLVATVSGRIDHVNAPRFEAELTPLLEQVQAGKLALVLDFSEVNYISSGGLRVLMIAATQLRSQQRRLIVAGVHAVVAEIFAISRFDRVLAIAADVEVAMAQCSADAVAAYRSATR